MFPSLTIGSHTFTWGHRTYVMGILNATPDSFSGDGLLAAQGSGTGLDLARRFLDLGVDILDVGGESTRPGAQPVSGSEEQSRVLPLINAILAEFPQTVLSIDTCKADVAEAALSRGVRIVNDVWGLRADPAMAEVVARHGAAVILMHNRSNPANLEVRDRLGKAYAGAKYQDLVADVKRDLMESVSLARQAGIPDGHIILDPGLGFGKSVAENLELIRRLDEICSLGFPVLLGPSRKSFIGYTLDLPPVDRLEGTAAAVAVGITRGADIVRVHDVEAMLRVVRMTDAIVRHPVD